MFWLRTARSGKQAFNLGNYLFAMPCKTCECLGIKLVYARGKAHSQDENKRSLLYLQELGKGAALDGGNRKRRAGEEGGGRGFGFL